MNTPAHPSPKQITGVWLLLVAATFVSWLLIEQHGISARIATTVAPLIAGVKARLVLRQFMELRTAPWVFGALFDAWIVVFVGAIIAGYWIALH